LGFEYKIIYFEGQPSTFCPADCGVSHIKVPGFNIGAKMDIEEKKAPGIMPPPKYGERKRRKDYFGKEVGREMRRHPIGGYFWQ
jgi:hypothetical protein